MIRIVLFFLSLTSFLPFSGNNVYTSRLCSNSFVKQVVKEKKQSKLSNENQDYVFIDDSDFDLEEEYHSCSANKNNGNTICFNVKNSKYFHQYWKYFSLNFSNYTKRHKNFPSFFGYISPNYFTNAILRI